MDGVNHSEIIKIGGLATSTKRSETRQCFETDSQRLASRRPADVKTHIHTLTYNINLSKLVRHNLKIGKDRTTWKPIIDSGAERSVISSRKARETGIPITTKHNFRVVGFDGVQSSKVLGYLDNHHVYRSLLPLLSKISLAKHHKKSRYPSLFLRKCQNCGKIMLKFSKLDSNNCSCKRHLFLRDLNKSLADRPNLIKNLTPSERQVTSIITPNQKIISEIGGSIKLRSFPTYLQTNFTEKIFTLPKNIWDCNVHLRLYSSNFQIWTGKLSDTLNLGNCHKAVTHYKITNRFFNNVNVSMDDVDQPEVQGEVDLQERLQENYNTFETLRCDLEVGELNEWFEECQQLTTKLQQRESDIKRLIDDTVELKIDSTPENQKILEERHYRLTTWISTTIEAESICNQVTKLQDSQLNALNKSKEFRKLGAAAAVAVEATVVGSTSPSMSATWRIPWARPGRRSSP